MTNVQIINREAVITLTADDWELYSHRRGAVNAAIRINKTIERAIAQGVTRRETETRALAVMHQLADLGAIDSEPLRHLEEVLNKLF